MIREAIQKTVEGQDLTFEESRQVMSEVMSGEASDAQIAALLVSLRSKGEKQDEVNGFASVMREKSLRIEPNAQIVVDTCGTGGDSSGTFNISTASALIIAGANVAVAKHGNCCMSSKCGSADVFEELGVRIDITPKRVNECINNVGIGFLFAQIFHPSMKFAAPARRDIGIKTVFNLLGPLTNPAEANRQIIGVFDQSIMNLVANALVFLGCQRAMVVHSADGLDEISTIGETSALEIVGEEIRETTIVPSRLGIPQADLADLKGGTPQENAEIIRGILNGERGPQRDIAILNAAAALYICGEAMNLREGMEISAASIGSGSALKKLGEMIAFTNV